MIRVVKNGPRRYQTEQGSEQINRDPIKMSNEPCSVQIDKTLPNCKMIRVVENSTEALPNCEIIRLVDKTSPNFKMFREVDKSTKTLSNCKMIRVVNK